MFRKPSKAEREHPSVEALRKALWYAERGHWQRARQAAKDALLELKEAEMPGSTKS